MKDNLDNFFKKYLSSDNPVSKDWNSPSDDVWINAIRVMDQKDKDRKIFWLWLIILLLSLGLLISAFFIGNLYLKNKSIVKAQKNEIINVKTNNKTDKQHQNFNTKQMALITGKDRANDKIKISSKTKIKTNHKPTSFQHNKLNQVGIKMQNRDAINTTYPDNYVSNKKINNRHNYNQTKENLTNSYINQIPSFKKRLYKVLDSDDKTDILTKGIIGLFIDANINKQKFRNNEISIFFGPAFTSTPMKDNRKTSSLHGYKELQLSSDFGLNYKYFFNDNYFAKIGVEYQTVKSWSYSNHEYKYDSKGEYTNSNGEILNMLTIPLPSPIGEMSTQNILRRSANITINDGDKLEINMESHQKYQFINIPIGLGLSKKINNNHIINIGVDFNLSYLLQLKNTFDASMFHNGEKMEMMKSTIVDIQKINKYIYGISGQVAYQYRFSDRFFWNLSVSYLRSINSIYSTKFSSTKIHGIHFNTGISLKF